MDLPNPSDPDWSWKKQGRVVACYRLAKGNSATQPFVLEPIDTHDVPYSGFERPCGESSEGALAGGDLEGMGQCKKKNAGVDPHWTPCTEFQKNPPALRANQILVVGIDISDLGAAGPDTKLELTGPNQNQLKLFNLNVTNQQGAPLNPAPVRASFPLATAAGGGSGSAGALGFARTDTRGDRSGWQWTYMGSRAPGGVNEGTPAAWIPNRKYVNGQIVSDATGRDFYRLDYFKAKRLALNVGAVDKRKCPSAPPQKPIDGCYYSGPAPQDPFPPEQTTDRIIDGEVVWQETSAPRDKDYPGTRWMAETPYKPGSLVCVLREENDEVATTVGKNHRLFSEAETDCGALKGGLKKHEHFHYYFAVKGGKSGEIPQDPFSINYLPRVIYLPWPYLLPGDVIPTFNVNLVYTPPTPGAPWQGNTFYPSGSVVIPGTGNGHYYTALTGGFSDLEPREPKFPAANPEKGKVHDGSLEWLDAGTSAPTIPSSPATASSQSFGGGGPQAGQQNANQGGPQGTGPSGGQAGKPMLWMPMTHFSLGDTVIRPESGHYFTMVESDSGFSGPAPSATTTGEPPRTDPFPPPSPAPSSFIDGQITWTKVSGPCPVATCIPWQANHQYSDDPAHTINGSDNKPLFSLASIDGTTYVMTSSTNPTGTSGSGATPFSGTPPLTDNQIEWRNVAGATFSQEWQANTPYSVGQAVCEPGHLGAANTCAPNHTFVVARVLVGTSGSQDPSSQPTPNPPVTVQDGDLIWAVVPAAWGRPHHLRTWAPLTRFNVHESIQAGNRLYYHVIRSTAGISGVKDPGFPITDYCTVVDPVVRIKDNSVEWQDVGTLRPRERRGCAEMAEEFGGRMKIPDWNQVHSANGPVPRGAVIFEPGEEGGRYYKALNGGIVGTFTPFVNITPPMLITWEDAGTTAPASVATGQPADQVVSLINLTLPQTHTLARFNISAGAGLSFVNRPPIFAWVAPTTPGVNLPTGPTSVPTTSSTTAFTYYYYRSASQIETTATTGAAAGVPTPIPTTVATTGAGAIGVAVEPQSQCTYQVAAVADTAQGAPQPPTGAPMGSTAMVYPVYECPLKTGTGRCEMSFCTLSRRFRRSNNFWKGGAFGVALAFTAPTRWFWSLLICCGHGKKSTGGRGPEILMRGWAPWATSPCR
jgi:hypothetical protein